MAAAFPLPGIVVSESTVHGLGAFAARHMPAGTVLGEYAGRRYTPKQAARVTWNGGSTYYFVLSDGSMIDGAQQGNATRHLNHSCMPNCEAVEATAADGTLTLTLSTVRAVRAGDELFIDYALQIDPSESAADYPCSCGSPACRGTMVAPPTAA